MTLSVAERLRSAAAFHYAEYPGVRLTVSKLCLDAGVNRGNAYVKHSELLRELTRSSLPKVNKKNSQERKDIDVQLNQLRAKYKKIDREYKALLNLCIEQMAEIRSLRIKIADLKENSSQK
jgi:hypothetical protein